MINLEKLLQEMSLHDKIGQLTQYPTGLLAAESTIVTGPMQEFGLSHEDVAAVGSVLNTPSLEAAQAIQAEHLKNDPHKIPMVIMQDVIHGYRTIYPIPLGLACAFDPEIWEDCARMAAKEASADGVHVTFAPMVDYVRDPRWGRVMESGGEEPLVTGRMAQAQIRGFQGEDLSRQGTVATCVKHYAAYGGAESGMDYNLVELSERELREFYLPAYKACLDAGAPMVMASFNALNGIPATANPMLMQKILRQEWGFDGVLISDYNAVGELIPHGVAANEKEAAKLAFENHLDIEMCSATYFHHLQALIEQGIFTEAQLDAAVLRVLKLKQRLGLFEDPNRGADRALADALMLCPEHRSVARKAATESAVLLKNTGLLPLSQTLSKVAVIGPFAHEHGINGSWSVSGKDADTVTVYQGLCHLLGQDRVLLAEGCGAAFGDADTSGFTAAVRAAEQAEAVVLCLGERQAYSGEGVSRAELSLPGPQLALYRAVLEANPNTAVVLFNGRPLAIPELAQTAPAILEMWFPGTEGGHAAADLLFGRANPCGRLTMSFPYSMGQCPVYYNRPNTGRPNWTSGTACGAYTAGYIDCPNLPLYSFGHGLSYSRFIYSQMTLSAHTLTAEGALQVRIRVKNDSPLPGREVVQLYIRDRVGSVVRPVQQLVDYQKLSFAPGEEKTVTFTLTEPMLRFYDMAGRHLSEPGEFDLMVGCPDNFVLQDRFVLQ